MTNIDYYLIAGYLLFSLLVSAFVFRKASTDRVSYFLGGRSIPWWWTGISIAATTFAADTPLAVTGLVARKGFAGNWIWLSWIIMHASVAIFFASMWRRSEVITDSQIITLRYSGNVAKNLRLFKSGFYALFFNCLILGWVIRAMVKILNPFFADTIMAGYESYILITIVALYSATGGLRAVIITDLVQLMIAIVGSYALAYYALDHVGGFSGLSTQLIEIYGSDHHYTNFIPNPDDTSIWTVATGMMFIMYLITQAFANSPADGGGYIMQRLSACESSAGAKKAAMLFIFIQYVVRLWPWITVALVALIIFPLGQEAFVHNGQYAYLATDREAAYPALMKLLLPPGVLGVAILGMLAAFMSTVDTHLNWGSSYIVNDFLMRFKPNASARLQVLVARLSVLTFAIAGVVVSFQVDNITQAWKWLSLFGACFSVPTLLRWFWWRVNAHSEFSALILGLVPAFYFVFNPVVNFQQQLVIVTAVSFLGMLIGVYFGPVTDEKQLAIFIEKVKPFGFWNRQANTYKLSAQFRYKVAQYLMLVLIIVCTFFIGQSLINGRYDRTTIYGLIFLFMLFCFEFIRKKLLKGV